MTKNAILRGIEHADAQARLLRLAKQIAPREDGPCTRPNDNPDGEWRRCGGCWPCIFAQLRETVAEVERTAVTFTEVAEAIEASVQHKGTSTEGQR